MRLYYYAFSGHKWGLDRVKRGVALIESLRGEGVDVQLLVSDFRAGLVAKELGVGDAITIENMMDIDVIAQKDDIVFLDTPEDISSRLKQYSDQYSKLFYIVDSCDIKPLYQEILITPTDDKLSSIMIDKIYFEPLKRVERRVFFFGDSDYDKELLNNRDFFDTLNIELILGNYFFVKYEDELAKIFKTLHEPEEYQELIRSSSEVVTTSIQTALEARASGTKVVYIQRGEDNRCLLDKLDSFGISIIDGFSNEHLLNTLKLKIKENKKVTTYIDIATQNIKNIVNL
jgi:hypothetical protein